MKCISKCISGYYEGGGSNPYFNFKTPPSTLEVLHDMCLTPNPYFNSFLITDYRMHATKRNS